MSDLSYDAALQSLCEMFGSSLPTDVINAFLLSCEGDVSQAIERLLTIDTEDDQVQSEITHKTEQELSSDKMSNVQNTREEAQQKPDAQIKPSVGASYRGAIPKCTTRQSRFPTRSNKISEMNGQLKRIVERHESGHCTLVMLRGVPGSGKSTLARQVVDVTVGPSSEHYRTHIVSADDFFLRNGFYHYDVTRLSEAHIWAKQTVARKLSEGLSPVIVDNTNIRLWEMEAYIRAGIQMAYYIEILEPNTPWAKKASQLAKKNTHNVPYSKILRMLDNYEDHHSVENIINMFHLEYQDPFIPPVIRKLPPLPHKVTRPSQEMVDANLLKDKESCDRNEIHMENKPYTTVSSISNVTCEYEDPQHREVLDLWDKGAKWTGDDTETGNVTQSSNVEPKPQREQRTREHSRVRSSTASPLISRGTDGGLSMSEWQQISSFVPAWDHDIVPNTQESKPVSALKQSFGTAMESGDHNIINSPYTVLTAKPRDINFSYVSPNVIKIPHTIMLDKSSMTTDAFDVHNAVNKCKNSHKHFIVLRKMFKNISEEHLRDIFDRCGGDVNWATEVLLDDGVPLSEQNISGDAEGTLFDDDDDRCTENCDCISEYEIAPRVSPSLPISIEPKPLELHSVKKKKEKVLSETSAELIRQIEQSVDISDYHYSNHCLKIKKSRHGLVGERLDPADTSNSSREVSACLPSTVAALPTLLSSPNPEFTPFNYTQDNATEDSSDTVDVTLGTELIRQAVKLIENTTEDVVYPGYILPVVNMPKSFLNHIYAMWMESLAHQIDMHHMEKEVLLKEDEKLARQLAKEEEDGSDSDEESFCVLEAASEAGAPTPGLREIMDEEVALSFAAREANEWRNVVPTDMATRLTQDKLYKLFPHIKQEILSELLVAHNHNFYNTVEALLTSTGQTDILKEKNGVSKFIQEKEAQMQLEALEKARQQERQEEEWPVLGGEKGKEALMENVNEYRQKAEEHLKKRNMNQQKARDYIARGMPEVAQHHTQLATFHKSQIDLNNSLAATTIVQVHAANKSNTTLDLHYLRVAEALQTLDVFLDYHIQALGAPNTHRHNSLFLVTGRGLHSPNGPRVKPAVKRRLTQRGFRALELNPGLLTVCVTDTHKLTHQIE